MPRHRAPSPSRLSITGVLAGTTLGASVLLPGTALAHPASSAASGHAGSADSPGSGPRHEPGRSRDADDGADRHRAAAHRHGRHHARQHAAHPRPLTSGERQYRNGCRQGYILDGCAQFDVPHLLRHGINPFG